MHKPFLSLRWTAALIGLLVLLGVSTQSLAATYYVRTDGGTNVQCNGTKDAPYSGSGTHQACAWSNLMEALPPRSSNQPNPAMIKGGDTLVIDAGSYMIGWSAGAVSEWGDNVCDSSYAYACVPQPVPSGTATNPTRIVGAGWDSGCVAPPELWGTESAPQILDMDSSSNVVIACLNLTDHSNCIVGYQPNKSYACVTKSTGTGTKDPGLGTWADKAIHAQDSSNVTLQDLNIHGFGDYGVQAGRISNWTVTRVTIAGNGNSGWNGDLGGNNQNSTNSGALTFTDFTVAWNGCAENYPTLGAYINCWGQNEGGYGDGLGEAWTGGNWVFVRPNFHHNTSDGLDLLYANGTGSISVDQGYFGLNAGNDLKTSGPATITNSVFDGYCTIFTDLGYPAGADSCRAGGGELTDVTGPNQTVTFAYNTVTGEGDCLLSGDQTNQSSSDVYVVSNNIFRGQEKFNGSELTCLTYYGDTPAATIKYAGNIAWNVRSNACPSGSICKDPQLTDETLATFNPTPLPSSPAIDNASTSYLTNHDQIGTPRPIGGGYDIGAIEYRGQPYLGSGSGDSPVPPSGGGGTQSAHDDPVPLPTASANPEPAGNKIAPSKALRGRILENLDRERYYRAGSFGWSAGFIPLFERPARGDNESDVPQMEEAVASVVPEAVAARPASRTSHAQAAGSSYIWIIYDWLRGVYDQSKVLFQ